MINVNLDKYFYKKYDEEKYNCCHFVCDIWKEITGDDITDIFFGFLTSLDKRTINKNKLKTLKQCDVNSELSIALFESKSKGWRHVGINMKGKILHLNEMGVYFLPVGAVMISYERVRYYTC